MLKEEFNSSLFPFWISNLESKFGNPLLEESCFVRSGSYGHGIVARLVSLDPARGDLGLPQFRATSVGFLFYGSDFRFAPFGCEVGLSRFIVSALFQLLFLVDVC